MKTMKMSWAAAVWGVAISMFLGMSALAQTQLQGSTAPGTMQGGGMMMQQNKSNMGSQDMNKMMADCDKMMKDKGMKMSGDMQQMMDQCTKVMSSEVERPKSK